MSDTLFLFLYINVIWWHLQVGSLSAQGAESPFFEEVMARATSALKMDLYATKARSFQISSDMAHAVMNDSCS